MQKNNKVLLCVDVSNNAYKASASHPTLTNGEVHTGGLYGFLGALAKAIEQTGATSICLCEDRKPYRRSQAYPEYKQLREDTKDQKLVANAKTTVEQIRNLCVVTGWPVWHVNDFECDDIIAHAVIHYRHRYDKVVAMCNDSDMYQLFQYKHFEMYKGKKGIYTRDDFNFEWKGLLPEELPMALAITGTHNDIAGIFGVGPAGARHAIQNADHMANLRKLHAAVIDRNLPLIKLPHHEFPKHEQIPEYTCAYDERQLIRFLSQYKIQLDRWISESFERVGK
jgi:5'-3' exonuclease